MTDLIEVFENQVDQATCQGLINIFESNPNVADSLIGYGGYSQNNALRRSVSLTLLPSNCGDIYNDLNQALQKAYHTYRQKYPILEKVKIAQPEPMNLVKYSDADQEYGWHVDGADAGLRYRFLSVVCYLNTVREGGETEFRLQHRKVKPKEGSVIIFPSGWTHEHRGLPPASNPKYIVTTWLRFGDPPYL